MDSEGSFKTILLEFEGENNMADKLSISAVARRREMEICWQKWEKRKPCL